MSKFVVWTGNAVAALLVVAIAYGAYLINRTKALNEDATEYTQDAIRAMVDPWNPAEFVKRAAPETMRQAGEKFVPELFAWYSRLGKLKTLYKPAGRVGTDAFAGSAMGTTWGAYSSRADFETGPAQIGVTLKRAGTTWQIADFQIRAEAFSRMRPPPSRDGELPIKSD